MNHKPRYSWTTVLLVTGLAATAAADFVILTPQNANETGFVATSGAVYLDEIATGSVQFALFEPEARGFARFDLSTIPAGSTIDGVRFVIYGANHDLVGRTTCPNPFHIGGAATDPVTDTGSAIWNAIGTGPRYVDDVLDRTGATFCLDSFIEIPVDLTAAMSDVEAALPIGYFTVSIQSDTPCDVDQDHLDWLGYSEFLATPDPGCTVSTLPGSRVRLEVTYTPPVSTCDIIAIASVGNLLASTGTSGTNVDLVWDADPEANGYNVWYVDNKIDIPDARQGGTGANPSGCIPTTVTTCSHSGAVPPTPIGSLLYYQVRGACGTNEAAE